jgi:hypothetical protein
VYIHAGSNANPQPCKYSLELQTMAEETIFRHASEYTTLAQFVSAQQSLLAHYHELTERMETSDSLHFAAPISGRHDCVDRAYRQAYTRLRNLAIRLSHESPPATEPPPSPQPLTDEEQLAFVERWIRENAQQTVFGSRAEGGEQ